jgi:hypothetical protein
MSFTRKLTTALLASCFVCFPAMAEREQFQCTLLAPTATAGTVLFADGTAAAPSMSFANDPDTGIARSAANAVGFATGANWRAHVTGIGFTIGNQPDFSGAPQNGILTATGGSGTNIAGADLRIRGGYSTGNASGGSLRFETSPAGSSGSAQNTLTERMRITSNGDLYVGNGDSSATPASSSIRATNGSGTNIGGANLSLYGGLGTGSGNGGVVAFFTSAAGGAGSGLNAATERMRITSSGAIYLGNGQFSSTNPATITLSTTEATGTDRAGTRLDIFGGRSTGSGAGGAITFTTSAAGGAGGGANTQTERMRVKQGGQIRFVPLAADPTLDVETGDVYYNSGTNKLRVYNGTAWVDLH